MSLRPTLLQYAAIWSPMAPVIVALLAGRAITPARRWTAIWCFMIVLQDVVGISLGRRGISNLWISYLFQPLFSAVLLWTLASWNPDRAASLAFRAAVPLVLIVSAALTLTLDDAHSFSLVVAPFHSIVMLLAAMWTFVSLGLREREQIVRQDWFWIIGGIMLYAATATAIQPLAWYLVRERVDLLHAAFNVRAAVVVLSFGAITWGMLFRRTRTSSGGFSSPPFSPSSSSSAG